MHIDVANQQRRSEKANVSTTDNPDTQTTLTSTSGRASSKSDHGETVALLGTCRLAVEGNDGRIFGSEPSLIVDRKLISLLNDLHNNCN